MHWTALELKDPTNPEHRYSVGHEREAFLRALAQYRDTGAMTEPAFVCRKVAPADPSEVDWTGFDEALRKEE